MTYDLSHRGYRAVVTGLGMITPLGSSADEVLARIAAGETAAAVPTGFDTSPFACRVCAEIAGFRPEEYVGESKTLRLMNRDAQLAVSAARLAVRDAALRVGVDYADDEVGLFGSTGLASLPMEEVARMVRQSAGPDGGLDLGRFGQVALRRVRPVLSFKILSNMPVCFVSIYESIRGPNAVYTPWQGQGAQAIAAGIRAIARGDARCAVVGGCDVKTNELAFLALQQQGALDAWRRGPGGPVPGEGAAFIVLEEERAARARGARLYARCGGFGVVSVDGDGRAGRIDELLAGLGARPADLRVSAGHAPDAPNGTIRPKAHLGDLFAAAAAVQFALAAALASRNGGSRVLAECFGHGSEQAAFVLESA